MARDSLGGTETVRQDHPFVNCGLPRFGRTLRRAHVLNITRGRAVVRKNAIRAMEGRGNDRCWPVAVIDAILPSGRCRRIAEQPSAVVGRIGAIGHLETFGGSTKHPESRHPPVGVLSLGFHSSAR